MGWNIGERLRTLFDAQAVMDRLRAVKAPMAGAAHILVPTALLLAAFSLRVSDSWLIRNFQYKLFDTFQTLRPRTYQELPVRIVDIDDESITRLGQWPWPRKLVADLVRTLAEAGASAISFDIVFSEPDRTSPDKLIAHLPQDPALRGIRAKLKALDNDQLLADTIKDANVVVGSMLTIRENAARPQVKAGFSHAGDSPLSYLGDYSGAIVTLPTIESAAAGNGDLTIQPDADGVIRTVPLLSRIGKLLVPSLSAETLRVAQGAGSIIVKSAGARGVRSFGEHTGISLVKIGQFVVPTDGEGRMWLHYTERIPGRTIPAWKVLSPGFDGAGLQGAITLIGTSAPGLMDLRSTPLSPVLPGVEVHAQAIEQIMLKHFLRRPDWADGAEILFLLVMGTGLIILLPRLGALWCAFLGISAICGAFAVSWHAFRTLHWLVDPLYPSLIALLVYLSSSTISFLRSETERRRLVAMDKLKDEFISTVSHDLRGPVNAMIMIVDMMSRGTYGPLTEKQSHNLKLIKDSGRKLTAFVTNILDAAKMKAGKMEFKKADVQLQAMIPNLVELFALSAQSKGLSLEHRVPPDLPVVSADREKLEQVVNNLVGNAMKFTPTGGKITISAEPDGEFVRVSVTDTGLGISQEDVSKLFKKFQQVDLATQKEMKVSGTGLGLSICKTVVEAHDGRIWVESEKGKGSSFIFTLPAKKAAAAPATAAPVPAAPVPPPPGQPQKPAS